jgi:hypothetical protein
MWALEATLHEDQTREVDEEEAEQFIKMTR